MQVSQLVGFDNAPISIRYVLAFALQGKIAKA